MLGSLLLCIYSATAATFLEAEAGLLVAMSKIVSAGKAEASYAAAARSFLLTHVQPNVAAQQAAKSAHATVSPTSLRVYAGFYSQSFPERQAAVEALLGALGSALRLRYSKLWDQHAMCVFVMKVVPSSHVLCTKLTWHG